VSADGPGGGELRGLFAEEASRRLEAIERGLAEEAPDLERLALEAHSLRGAARVLGLDETERLAGELEETFAPGGPLDETAIRRLLAAVREALPVAGPGSAVPVQGARAGSHTVLYVEDSSPNAVLVSRILARRGDVRLLAAATGEEGLRLAREQRPALVLVDVRLPDMDGSEVVRRLREEPATSSVPVVAVTGGVEKEQLDRLQAGGVVDVLYKPFDAGRLLSVVSRALPHA
jgi:CheY-like chemotaxis protein